MKSVMRITDANNTVITVKDDSEKIILTVRRVICYIVLGILTFFALFPFITLFINSTRSHMQLGLGFSFLPGTSLLKNLRSALTDAMIPILAGMRNSLFVTVVASVLSVYFSAFTAYGIHVYNFKLKKAAFTFIMIIMMVPAQVSAPGFLNLIDKFGMMNTFAPLIIPTIAAPATFFFMKNYMESSLPIEIIEAARVDGCNELRIFNQIILPVLKPAIAVQLIFSFVTNWNNYFMPALILEDNNKKTLPVLIAMIRSADFLKLDMGKLYVFIALSILPVVVVYLALSKFIVGGVTLGAVKG